MLAGHKLGTPEAEKGGEPFAPPLPPLPSSHPLRPGPKAPSPLFLFLSSSFPPFSRPSSSHLCSPLARHSPGLGDISFLFVGGFVPCTGLRSLDGRQTSSSFTSQAVVSFGLSASSVKGEKKKKEKRKKEKEKKKEKESLSRDEGIIILDRFSLK